MDRKALEQSHHEAGAEQHANLANCMKSLAEFHQGERARLEMTDPSAAAGHGGAHDACAKAADCHAALAEDHVRMHKAIGDLETAELQSSGGTSRDVRQLAETVADLVKHLSNGGLPHNVRTIPPMAVPRPGQRDVTADTRKAVDVSLRSVLLDEPEPDASPAQIRSGFQAHT